MFILELDKVSSLTQARFAAGEGFTHVCFDLKEMDARQFSFQAIRDFLSGVKIGIWADRDAEMDLTGIDYVKERLDHATVLAAPTQPGDKEAEFMVVNALPDRSKGMKCVLSIREDGLNDLEGFAENLASICGVSLLAPKEERTGFLTVSDELRDFLDMLEDKELKLL